MSTTSQDVPVLTVTQFTNAIKHNLETAFPSIWVQGEVSNAKLHSSGHFYFSLKDANAQISAVMFRGSVSSLKAVPKDGDEVVAYGSISVYPQAGRYQIMVQQMRHVGAGELLLKLEELKQKLMKKGWFKKERKKPLPKFPERIGVVTSPTGAAIQDMLHILTRRFNGFHLILNPVKVQGEGAAKEIAQAIRQFNEHKLVDVMIVGRGGGSIEDLWAFNEEIVAEAIFESKIPVIGAVGHETDHCIAEYVADVRAPTPSAAAEIVMGERAYYLERLAKDRAQIVQTLQHIVKAKRAAIDGIMKQPILRSPYAILGQWMLRCDDFRHKLDQSIRQAFCQAKIHLKGHSRQLATLNPMTKIAHSRERLRQLEQHLRSIDPKNLLKKGYSILFSEKNGSVVHSIKQIRPEDQIKVLLSDGEAISIIKEVVSCDKEGKKL